MPRKYTRFILSAFLLISFGPPASADEASGNDWVEKLNKDDIVVWTRKVEGYKIDSYRAQADLDFPIRMIYDHLTNLAGFPQWVQHLESFEVISEEEGRWVFYEIINPPVGRKRDYVGMMTGKPPGSDGTAEILQVAVEGYREKQKDYIRISDFHETWKLVKLSDTKTRATLEVLYDPGGNPPVAALNWMVAQGPYESFMKMREYLGQK